jgi:hypothetical protein
LADWAINYGESTGRAEADLLEEVVEGLRRYRRGEYEKQEYDKADTY